MADSMPQIATQEEMYNARLPLAYRDRCAHILIPLNQCRQETCYRPWKCMDLKHGTEVLRTTKTNSAAYEKCEYNDFKRRMEVLRRRKEASATVQSS